MSKIRKKLTIGIDASRAFVDEPAGPEYYSLHLIQSIAKIDKTNHFTLYVRPGQKIKLKLPQNFKLKIIQMKYLWTQLGLAVETILRPPDALFVPAHTLPVLTRILRPQLPILVTVHGLEGRFLPQSSSFWAHIYRNWSIGWAVKFATYLIAVSNSTRDDILKNYKTSSNRIQVVHEGVDWRHFSDFASAVQNKNPKHQAGGSYILFVGTIQPRKNLIRLIKAFSMLPFRNMDLVIAGKLGWLYEGILAAPRRFGVENRVKFIGRVEDMDLPALYKGARIFVLPSITEGFGLPILEAQAAGVPVVASKGGAIPEIAGTGAILVNPLSAESIKKGLLLALTNSGIRRRIIMEGRKNARNFSWESAARSTLQILTKLARERS